MARTDPPAWVTDAIVYQIFPDRFARSPRVHKPGRLEDWDAPPTRHGFKGGDLLGIVEHLDYLVDLGINTISLNPIFASAANHRYHTYDYRQVDPLLGGEAAFRELLDTAHQRGLRVILDGVFNHAGRGFWPFHHVLENGAASPYLDWFVVNPEWLSSGRPLHAYPESQDSAAPRRRESLSAFGYRAWWDLPALPKLNTDNPDVREFLLTVAEDWTRFGADGWRLDVATEIARRLGVKVEWKTPAWDTITSGHWSGRWDISVGSMTVTPERAQVLDFTPAYYYTPAGLAVNKANTSYSQPSDLDGKKIGVCGDCTYEKYLEHTLQIPGYNISFKITNPQIHTYDTDTTAIADLSLGDGVRLDAVMSAIPTLDQAIKQGKPIKLLDGPLFFEPLAVAIDKSSTLDPASLLSRVSQIVTQMHQDGTLSQMSMHWYGEDLTVST